MVSFDFDLSSAGQRANSLHKINLLVDTLIQFRDALQAEADLAAERSRGKKRGARNRMEVFESGDNSLDSLD